MERRRQIGIQWRIPEPLQVHIKLAAMFTVAAAPLLLLTAVLPRSLVLPTLCLIATAGAGIAALFAWRHGCVRSAQHVTAWDVAGALAFIACAAAILGDPQQVISLIDDTTTANVSG